MRYLPAMFAVFFVVSCATNPDPALEIRPTESAPTAAAAGGSGNTDHRQVAATALTNADWQTAIAHLNEAIRAAATAEDYVNLGYVHYRRGDAVKAFDAFNEALRLEPNHARARDNVAALITEYGDTALKDKVAQRAGALPKDVNALFAHAMQLSEQGDDAGAISQLEKALAIQQDYKEALVLLSWEDNHIGKYQPAVDAARKAIAVDGSYPHAHYNLAIALAHLDQPRDSAASLARAAELTNYYDTIHGMARHTRAFTMLALWEGETAAQEAAAYIRVKGTSDESFDSISAVQYLGLLQAGDTTAAAELLAKHAPRVDKQGPPLLAYLLGHVDVDEAVASYPKETREVPQSLIGVHLLLTGRKEDAQKYLKAAARDGLLTSASRLATAALAR